MIKISASVNGLRIFHLIVGISPFIFNVVVQVILANPIFDTSLLLVFLFTIPFTYIFVKYGVLDWDFYFVEDHFYFRKLKREFTINKKTSFKINWIFIGSSWFNVYEIRFKTGQVFYFKSRKFSLITDPSVMAEKLEKEILELVAENS